MCRVVITGMGLLSPLGVGTQHNWERITSGATGIKRIEDPESSDLYCQVVGRVPRGTKPGELILSDWFSKKETRRLETFILFASIASKLCLADSGWKPKSEIELSRSGVMIGSGIGGIDGIEKTILSLHSKGQRHVSPFSITSSLINSASGFVAIENKFTGPCLSIVTACATGSHSIGEAARIVATGDADFILAGGTESSIGNYGLSAFGAMRALSSNFNDSPEKASRPWDKDRDGFVMSEGSAVLAVENYEHAKARGAKIYAEILGYGLSNDAFHLAAPSPDSKGICQAMDMAIRKSGLDKKDIGYINAHATSTPKGDDIEIKGVEDYFGSHSQNISMSSTKGATGHLLGAAGSLEAAFTILTLVNNIFPPTLNLYNPSYSSVINRVPLKKGFPKDKLCGVMNNSFGFGGVNACLIFGLIK